MGRSISEICSEVAKHLWHFCIQESIWILRVHIPGKESTVVDYMSRFLSENTEWQLAPIIFKNTAHSFNFIPQLDLFVSYFNSKVPCYVSWFPDSNAVANNAFSVPWKNKKKTGEPSSGSH